MIDQVDDSETILRGIPKRCIRWDPKTKSLKVTRNAFIRREQDVTGLSVERAKYISAIDATRSGRFPWIMQLNTGYVRSLKLDVEAKVNSRSGANIIGLPPEPPADELDLDRQLWFADRLLAGSLDAITPASEYVQSKRKEYELNSRGW